MNNTPETDQKAVPHIGFYSCATVPAEFARKLERDRDEARAGRHAYKELAFKHAQERDEARVDAAALADKLSGLELRSTDELARLEQERNEARGDRDTIQTELEMWRDGNILHEVHRNELEKVEQERDEAREALMKIEDLFIDGTDIYADRENMGIIARNALEGAK